MHRHSYIVSWIRVLDSSYPWLRGINLWLPSHMKVDDCHVNVCIMQQQTVLWEGRHVNVLEYWEVKERELIHI
jgi:hypothetical protein